MSAVSVTVCTLASWHCCVFCILGFSGLYYPDVFWWVFLNTLIAGKGIERQKAELVKHINLFLGTVKVIGTRAAHIACKGESPKRVTSRGRK